MAPAADPLESIKPTVRKLRRRLFRSRIDPVTKKKRRPLAAYLAVALALMLTLMGGAWMLAERSSSCRSVQAMIRNSEAVFPKDPVTVSDPMITRTRLTGLTETDYRRWAETMGEEADRVRHPRLSADAQESAYLADKMARLRGQLNPKAPGSSPRQVQDAAAALTESRTLLYENLENLRKSCA